MILTVLTLVFLVMIGLGGTNSSNNYLSNLYFIKANTTNVTANPDFSNNPANPNTDPMDKTPDNKIIIQNYYTVSLWGYCAGAGDNTTRSILAFGQKTAATVDFCSPRQLQYGFDPSQVWGLSPDAQQDIFSNDFYNYVNNTYLATNRKWMSTLFILACVSTGLQLFVGIGGLFSRLGSLFTTLSSLFTTGFIFAFAVITTLTYTRFAVSANLGLDSLGISMSVGTTMLAYMWLAFSTSFIAGLFWAFSSCCCSAHPREQLRKGSGSAMAERVPYSYERVTDAPYGVTQTVNAERAGPYATPQYRHGQ
ncbi:MAG: hypothetical protein LQ340_005091 [Diploschistes diacapsis]|nr:MAG: hypothetical protein LQ340_005091 [Diploschistes diacapsis]